MRPDLPQDISNVGADEGVLHEGLVMGAEEALERLDIARLVSGDKRRHGLHFGVIAVGLGFLGAERVDIGLGEHAGEGEILEALHFTRFACFVITLESLEEIGGRLVPLELAHVHFAPALPNDAHHSRVWDGAFYGERLLVQLLQLLGVLLLRVHADLHRVDFQELRPFLRIVFAVWRFARVVELLHYWLQPVEILCVQVEVAQLHVRPEPKPVVARSLQRLQCGVEEFLKKLRVL